MLTGKQKRFLRSKAHHLKPVAQIGKEGLTEAAMKQILETINVRELIKVNILQNCFEEKEEMVPKFEEAGIMVVQQIGNIFVLYKEAEEDPQIVLPS